jgi:hypothetical protein
MEAVFGIRIKCPRFARLRILAFYGFTGTIVGKFATGGNDEVFPDIPVDA